MQLLRVCLGVPLKTNVEEREHMLGKSPKIYIVCKRTQTCNRRLTCIGIVHAWLSHDGAATWISGHRIAEIYALGTLEPPNLPRIIEGKS